MIKDSFIFPVLFLFPFCCHFFLFHSYTTNKFQINTCMIHLCNHSNKLSSFTCKWQEQIHKHHREQKKNSIIHIKCTKVNGIREMFCKAFASVTTAFLTFFVLMMQWRLHLLYILTLSERTTVHLSSFTSFIHVVMCVHWVELQPSVDAAKTRWPEGDWQILVTTAKFREEMSTFFFSMLRNVQYLEMILFTDSLYNIFVSLSCVCLVAVWIISDSNECPDWNKHSQIRPDKDLL